jgi:hypothetical protein
VEGLWVTQGMPLKGIVEPWSLPLFSFCSTMWAVLLHDDVLPRQRLKSQGAHWLWTRTSKTVSQNKLLSPQHILIVQKGSTVKFPYMHIIYLDHKICLFISWSTQVSIVQQKDDEHIYSRHFIWMNHTMFVPFFVFHLYHWTSLSHSLPFSAEDWTQSPAHTQYTLCHWAKLPAPQEDSSMW